MSDMNLPSLFAARGGQSIDLMSAPVNGTFASEFLGSMVLLNSLGAPPLPTPEQHSNTLDLGLANRVLRLLSGQCFW